jgi:hypothetical protein
LPGRKGCGKREVEDGEGEGSGEGEREGNKEIMRLACVKGEETQIEDVIEREKESGRERRRERELRERWAKRRE